METCLFSLKARATGPNLTLRTYLDGQLIHEQVLTEVEHEFMQTFEDTESSHVFEIELANKTTEHTTVDEENRIVSDAVVEISEFALDGIELGHTFFANSKYTHDFNGTATQQTDPFYGTMGCNGRVRFEFTSPVYLWLLEHM
jgi:hypothetical protein